MSNIFVINYKGVNISLFEDKYFWISFILSFVGTSLSVLFLSEVPLVTIASITLSIMLISFIPVFGNVLDFVAAKMGILEKNYNSLAGYTDDEKMNYIAKSRIKTTKN